MQKPIRISRSKYDNIFIGSDFHYNHQRDFLWKPRGFKSFEEHDRFIESECERLSKNDLLIYLGDYSLNSSFESSHNLLTKISPQIVYVMGNHESFHTKFLNQSFSTWAKNNNFPPDCSVFPFSVNKWSGAGVPGITNNSNDITYHGEEFYAVVDKFHIFCRHMAPLIWDKMKYDNYVSLCGHSHGNLKCATPFETNSGKILDVGVDNAIKYNGTAFFSIEEVEKIMRTKKIAIFDHHGDENV